ncbi:uncharacterized protein B0I36DRAFT_315693 [Microdochium trichocladiopsis]|uniref:Response regulatory domain-containing protein n=1 Tax=Microdochium trichocladiopsis TaxID=1682393 RepID=A0A9P8YEV3_9PEZI|nr:uncharacterized protein B0I36DRAFT_315693 [Microdochium trichocladiopsis]KAH7038165.1 hypothetical protein B0I36DRAFT_315693 [Microdochium trichocladiopsis]
MASASQPHVSPQAGLASPPQHSVSASQPSIARPRSEKSDEYYLFPKATRDDSDQYYSFPRSSSISSNTSIPPTLPSLLNATTNTPAKPSMKALEAAASLSALLSDPQQLHEKWEEHHRRILEAILPDKGFDSVTIQLPARTRSLNTAAPNTLSARSSTRTSARRLPVPAANLSSTQWSTTPEEPTTPLTEDALAALNGATSSRDNNNTHESRLATRPSGWRQKESKPTEEQVAQAAATVAAIAVGTASGTTGAIASAAAAAAALCQEEQKLSRREAKSAFTLLCVDDDVISCKIMSKICEKWGQPYETVTSGERALELYKQAPEKYRCILMDIVMPGQDGFQTTKMIREFEEASWTKDPAEGGNSGSFVEKQEANKELSADTQPRPIRRTVIIGMAMRTTPPPPMDVIKETGFDLVVEKPLHLRLLSELLFSGPETNAVAVYGGVDPESLRQAGYPLRMRPLGAPRRPPLESVFGSSFG